ncbi:MAG: hypothetical protein B7X03_03610 [Parcubacteria group bacterium 21-58-10]|nr:MAG: hypothetical protein B7X03_03610 [Parcubacteria group bacterium 21-58-10]
MNTRTEDYVDVTDELRAAEAINVEIAALEADTSTVAAGIAKAVNALGEIRLSPIAQRLLNDATINVANNKAVGLTGSAKEEALQRAALLKAANEDLPTAIDAICRSVPEDTRGGVIYSLVYAIQKAAVFQGNLMYRRHIDPRADIDEQLLVDQREAFRAPPYGLGPDPDPMADEAFEHGELAHTTVLRAVEELHIWLQLMTEAFGWDPERPMPYLVVMAKDGGFVQITDALAAFDLTEVRNQERRARRQDERARAMKVASGAALAFIKQATSKREAA